MQVIAADGNGNSAAADVTITVTDVDLGTPYDRDHNEVIDREEAVAAVVDFIGGLITKEEAVAVVVLYLTGGQGQQAATPVGVPASPGTTKGSADVPAKEASGAADQPGEDDGELSRYIEQRNGPGPDQG